LPHLGDSARELIKELDGKLAEHSRYIREHGVDMPEVREWRWSSAK
jgi:xylulose-5-phosphate/fructose-6-phosphate phosphoketolase